MSSALYYRGDGRRAHWLRLEQRVSLHFLAPLRAGRASVFALHYLFTKPEPSGTSEYCFARTRREERERAAEEGARVTPPRTSVHECGAWRAGQKKRCYIIFLTRAASCVAAFIWRLYSGNEIWWEKASTSGLVAERCFETLSGVSQFLWECILGFFMFSVRFRQKYLFFHWFTYKFLK